MHLHAYNTLPPKLIPNDSIMCHISLTEITLINTCALLAYYIIEERKFNGN